MPGPPIATVTTYLGLVEALRARCDQLKISREALDHVSGLQCGYSAKLLTIPDRQQSMRTLGRLSFDLLIPALALKLQLVEDESLMPRLRSRLDVQHRDEAQVRSSPSNGASTRSNKNSPGGLGAMFLRTIGTLGGYARARKLSPERRIAIARRAARARWRRAREEAR
jgi:hypothetical protein